MNNSNIVNIERVTHTTVVHSNKIAIYVSQVELFKSANISVHFYNEDGNGIVKVVNLKLEGEDYSNWSSNDKYIETYVLNKLNLISVSV